MPRGKVTVDILAPARMVFDLIHDYDRRLQWDAMLSEARILGDAKQAGKGVRTLCVGTWRSAWLGLETEYINFEPGRVAAVKLVNRPPFYESFAATIRHQSLTENSSRVTYIYSFRARPRGLRFVLEPIMNSALRQETARRLHSLRTFLEARR